MIAFMLFLAGICRMHLVRVVLLVQVVHWGPLVLEVPLVPGLLVVHGLEVRRIRCCVRPR